MNEKISWQAGKEMMGWNDEDLLTQFFECFRSVDQLNDWNVAQLFCQINAENADLEILCFGFYQQDRILSFSNQEIDLSLVEISYEIQSIRSKAVFIQCITQPGKANRHHILKPCTLVFFRDVGPVLQVVFSFFFDAFMNFLLPWRNWSNQVKSY